MAYGGGRESFVHSCGIKLDLRGDTVRQRPRGQCLLKGGAYLVYALELLIS